MKAVSFHVSVPRYLLARALGGMTSSVTFGRLSGLKYGDWPAPGLPGEEWARLRVLQCGICGTDLSNLTFSVSPALEPFSSFPAVPGHEVLARVEEVGGKVEDVAPGDRVVVDPLIGCRVREQPRGDFCSSCRDGLPATCGESGESGPLRVEEEPLAPGMIVGYHRDLPGGWGEEMVAHRSQLHRVPDDLGDRAAVLTEPLSISVHAVLRAPPESGGPVLVIGSGPMAMTTIWALRATGYEGLLVAQAKRKKEKELARLMGADEVVSPGDEARQALVDETGAMAYQPLVGPEVYAGGGFPSVYDCVGSRGSFEQALGWTAPRGRIVMLGCAARTSKLDLTFLWARELDVRGVYGYGTEVWEGEDRHTFQLTLELLQTTPAPVDRLVTHVFPLSQLSDALNAAANRKKSEAMKVVLTPPGSP